MRESARAQVATATAPGGTGRLSGQHEKRPASRTESMLMRAEEASLILPDAHMPLKPLICIGLPLGRMNAIPGPARRERAGLGEETFAYKSATQKRSAMWHPLVN